MCLLAIVWRVVREASLVVAANREEAYARAGTPPQLVADRTRFVAGLDPQAGGTWLGVNQHGLLVAVANRIKSQVLATPRSRGLLVRDLLQCASAKEAVEQAAAELDKRLYAGCNLLCADRVSAQVIHAGDWLQVWPLPAGIHVLASRNLNNDADPRIAYALARLGRLPLGASLAVWIEELKALCGKTGDDESPPICLRGSLGGTVSSSIIALGERLQDGAYLHAQGPPDRTPYEDYSPLLARVLED